MKISEFALINLESFEFHTTDLVIPVISIKQFRLLKKMLPLTWKARSSTFQPGPAVTFQHLPAKIRVTEYILTDIYIYWSPKASSCQWISYPLAEQTQCSFAYTVSPIDNWSWNTTRHKCYVFRSTENKAEGKLTSLRLLSPPTKGWYKYFQTWTHLVFP